MFGKKVVPNLKDEPSHIEGKGHSEIIDGINKSIPPSAPHEGEKPTLVIGPAGPGGEKNKG